LALQMATVYPTICKLFFEKAIAASVKKLLTLNRKFTIVFQQTRLEIRLDIRDNQPIIRTQNNPAIVL